MKRLPMWIERAGGLRFACTACGDCCRAADAYVWVTPEEAEGIAGHLGLSMPAFGTRYLRMVDGDLALVDHPGRDACVFWEDQTGCRVYDARPEQCRTFPFWPENVRSCNDWREVGGACPGVGGSGEAGRLYPAEEISALLVGDGATEAGHPEESGA